MNEMFKGTNEFFKEVNNIINEKSLMRKIIALSCGKHFNAFFAVLRKTTTANNRICDLTQIVNIVQCQSDSLTIAGSVILKMHFHRLCLCHC